MSSPKQRLEWIDLFRGLAVAGMIETHAGNTFLEASLQKGAVWSTMTYYNGLVAPAFFWILGYVRGMTFHRTSMPKPAWPSVKRLLMILAVGYAMHLPYGFSTGGDFSDETQWKMFMVDVLQCLAVSGLCIVAIERAGKNAQFLAAGAMGAFIATTNHVQLWSTGFIPLDAYFTSEHGSLFPLFPWAAFAFSGFMQSAGDITRLGSILFALFLAFGLRHVPWIDWTFGFFFERVGWVTLVAAFCARILEPLAQRARNLTGWLFLAGRESLVLYVAHLTLIHALPTPALSPEKQIGPTQPPWVVALIFVALLASSVALGALNEWRKRKQQRRAA